MSDDATGMVMTMDWELSRFGLGDSIEPETAIIALIVVLGLACLGPLLAMGGRSGADKGDDGGHPVRSRLRAAERDRPSPRKSNDGRRKHKTNIK